MSSFADYFSAKSTIEELCRARVMLARTRHDAAFSHNIAPDSTPAHAITPDWGSIPEDIFPPRRQWHRFRSKHREGSNAADLNYCALRRAVFELRKKEPYAPWAMKLDETVKAIRRRVMSARPFHFQRPKVIAIKKKPGSHEYRPLALYTLADKIIEGLTARYFRTHLDSWLLKPCLAFRCGSKRQPPPTTHDALSMILQMKSRHPGEALYVAECDVKGFFDCVGHAAARQGLEHLIEDTRGNFRPHRRALEIFGAYLESYSFLASVRDAAQTELSKRDPRGTFKCHEADLQKLYGGRALPPIGVPQGAALSCLIANAVLHQADKAISAIQEKSEIELLYLRFGDDTILISPDRALCVAAFAAYRRAL